MLFVAYSALIIAGKLVQRSLPIPSKDPAGTMTTNKHAPRPAAFHGLGHDQNELSHEAIIIYNKVSRNTYFLSRRGFYRIR